MSEPAAELPVLEPFLQDPDFTLYVGDVREVLAELASESVHCVVTSPPYFGLRDYGADGQIGLEPLPDCLGWATGERCGKCYVCEMVGVFRELRRVLRSDGTVWLNIGDSYASNQGAQVPDTKNPKAMAHRTAVRGNGIKAKDKILVPHRLALALQMDGWWVRQDNVWNKPNVMPESADDRMTTAHEYVFHLSKSPHYFFDQDAVKEDAKWERWGAQTQQKDYTDVGRASMVSWRTKNDIEENLDTSRRNPRSVWDILTKPFAEAHFAVFPPELPTKCIMAGTSEKGCCPTCHAPWERVTGRDCPECGKLVPTQAKECEHCGFRNTEWREQREENDQKRAGESDTLGPLVARKSDLSRKSRSAGWQPTCKHEHDEKDLVPCVVLDPFLGSGTTAIVARSLGRHSIGIELNAEYAQEIVEKRTAQQGLLV